METIKQIPYGVADFESVMNQNFTMSIRLCTKVP